MLGAVDAEEDGALPPPVDTAAGEDVASVGKSPSVEDGAVAAVVEDAAAAVEDAADPESQQPPVQHSSEDGQP